jgi:hypothetical protein
MAQRRKYLKRTFRKKKNRSTKRKCKTYKRKAKRTIGGLFGISHGEGTRRITEANNIVNDINRLHLIHFHKYKKGDINSKDMSDMILSKDRLPTEETDKYEDIVAMKERILNFLEDVRYCSQSSLKNLLSNCAKNTQVAISMIYIVLLQRNIFSKKIFNEDIATDSRENKEVDSRGEIQKKMGEIQPNLELQKSFTGVTNSELWNGETQIIYDPNERVEATI